VTAVRGVRLADRRECESQRWWIDAFAKGKHLPASVHTVAGTGSRVIER